MNRHNSECVLRVLFVISLMGLTILQAHGETVKLKEDVYVKGPKLYLGDIADIEGSSADKLAAIEVAPAAMAGSSKRIHSSLIKNKIARTGAVSDDIEVTGANYVRATTLHLELTKEMLAEDLRSFIETEMPWAPQDAVISVETPYQDLIVPDGEVAIKWRPNPMYRYIGSGSFRAQIKVDGHLKKTLNCRAIVDAYTDVVVAINDIPRGNIVNARDLEIQKRSTSTIPAGVCKSKKELEGNVARTTIFPGQVITKRKIMPRRIIKRNQIVVVTVDTGTLHLQTQCKAMSDACIGDLITCRNLDSKNEFIGIVRPDGTVAIQ